MINFEEKYADVIGCLEENTDRYLTSDMITDKTGHRGTIIRDCVRHARREGYFISSDHRGYRIVTDEDEILRTIEQLELRAQSINKTAAKMREHLAGV